MIPDIRFEADFLRASLLLGLVREHEVMAWANALLANATESVALLADVALARPELTTVREALRPLAEPSEPSTSGAALLAFLTADPTAAALVLPDRIRVLTQLRREGILAEPIASALKSFEDRWMLASAGVGADQPLAADVDRWLAAVRQTAYYRISLERGDERAALLGALSRKVVRNRRAPMPHGSGSCAWIVKSPSVSGPALMLNEALWQIAVAEFSPLPLGSRIPYARVPAQAVLVLDETTAEPMGAREADDRLAAV